MQKSFLLLLFISFSTFCFGQDLLMNEQQISEITKKVIDKLERLESKPKKKKRKEKFINAYNKMVTDYTYKLDSGKTSILGTNWEKMLNALYVLQDLNSRASASEVAKPLVDTKNYGEQIEKISQEAVADLYEKGKSAIEKNENEFTFQNGYEYFYRANQISPNFKDSKSLMETAVKKGEKIVSFQQIAPYRSISSNQLFVQSGDANNFIIEKLINDISTNMVGSHLVDYQNLGADWMVEIKWTSINTPPERKTSMSHKRSSKINENGEDKEVTADVTYNTTYTEINGALMCQVKSRNGEKEIFTKEINGFMTSDDIEVTYTGDKRALTQEDLSHIDNPFEYTVSNPENLIKEFYKEQIHPQLLDELGYLLNWNYKFRKE